MVKRNSRFLKNINHIIFPYSLLSFLQQDNKAPKTIARKKTATSYQLSLKLSVG